MRLYVWKGPFVAVKNAHKADPQKVGEELDRLAGDKGLDCLRTKAVVEAARPPRSVLHKHFEWNDGKAAEAHRLYQARQLIGSIRLKLDNNQPPRPVFVSLSAVDGRAYRSVEVVQKSVNLQAELAKAAVSELQSMIRRYQMLSDLAPLLEAALRQAAKEAGKDLAA
jgi:hypothetical protein